jgi:hypothetical protein
VEGQGLLEVTQGVGVPAQAVESEAGFQEVIGLSVGVPGGFILLAGLLQEGQGRLRL